MSPSLGKAELAPPPPLALTQQGTQAQAWGGPALRQPWTLIPVWDSLRPHACLLAVAGILFPAIPPVWFYSTSNQVLESTIISAWGGIWQTPCCRDFLSLLGLQISVLERASHSAAPQTPQQRGNISWSHTPERDGRVMQAANGAKEPSQPCPLNFPALSLGLCKADGAKAAPKWPCRH